jgi:hypothetical protein
LTYYEYDDLVKPLLSLCFEKREHYRGPVEELKRGIPDFIVWEMYEFQKRPFFVEVKSNQSTLTEQQRELFISLGNLTKVYIFRVNIPNVIFKVDFRQFI